MTADWGDVAALLAGTAVLRPYVAAFLAVFLLSAARDLGAARALVWLGWGYLAAFAAEWASTRTGFPFGLYHYSGATAGRELFVSNVPLFDSLSFPFLAYAAWCLARAALGRARGWRTVALAGLLMTAADVVIDPLAVRGDRWFLGAIFHYAEPGIYFGVPLLNFAGWALVGWVIVGGALAGGPARAGSPRGGVGLYYAVLVFNLGITAWIGEWRLLGAGILLHVGVFLVVYRLRGRTAAASATGEDPPARAAAAGVHRAEEGESLTR